MSEELKEVHALIDLCMRKLEVASAEGNAVASTTLNDAQILLSTASGKLHSYRKIEREAMRSAPRNIIRFPGT